jgi:hypothetical protein
VVTDGVAAPATALGADMGRGRLPWGGTRGLVPGGRELAPGHYQAAAAGEGIHGPALVLDSRTDPRLGESVSAAGEG